MSRATFDNYVKEGKLPKSRHQAGFKEIFWYKEDFDKFIDSKKYSNELLK
jgi:predicted DNA-binding transcriptional regulator AlpA